MNEANQALLDGLEKAIIDARATHHRTHKQLCAHELERDELEARHKDEKALLDSMIKVRKTLVKQYTTSTTGDNS